jgi:hypothetical protein
MQTSILQKYEKILNNFYYDCQAFRGIVAKGDGVFMQLRDGDNQAEAKAEVRRIHKNDFS